MVKQVCGDCKKRMSAHCPRYQYKGPGSYELNQAACMPKDSICENFQLKTGERRKKPLYKDSGFAQEGYFEAIYYEDKPAFLARNSDEFKILETVTCNETTYQPKDVKRIPYTPYGYYSGTIPSREELFWKIRNEFRSFIDVEDIWRDVLSSCVLLSYHQEKLQTVPYIFIYGDNESGKSTVLQILKFLCYRPMYGVTVPSADIYGYLDDVNSIGCVLEDEIQGVSKDIDKVKIYKAGYKQGAVVPRTLITQFDRIIKYYNTFCFKACASERIPWVKGFRERFLEIAMIEGFPELEWSDVTDEDLKRLQDLRNMLLKWRMLSKGWQLPNPDVSMRGRIKELWKPLLQIVHGLTVYKTLAGFVKHQRDERLSAKQNTLEGHIVKVVTEIHNKAKTVIQHVPFQTIWQELALDLDGRIEDRKPHVMDTAEFFRVTKSKVGYRLREVLSGKSKVVREKNREGIWFSYKAYEFDKTKLGRVAKKYGYELVTKLPTLPSPLGIKTSIPTGINDEKDHKDTFSTMVENHEKGPYIPPQLGKLGNTVTKEGEDEPGSCFLCKKLLPKNLANTTVVESRFVHLSCALDYERGRKEVEK